MRSIQRALYAELTPDEVLDMTYAEMQYHDARSISSRRRDCRLTMSCAKRGAPSHRPDGDIKVAIPAEMGGQVAVALYVVAMAAIIVGVDVAFFRDRFWERLIVNIGIFLVFAAFYLRFLRRP